ncbi:MAG TPA: hypothetical protein VK689_21900 [Armatimonadota bacterium]|nr:hypothetical protein [Armatimonadota bacterium]
MQYADKPFIDDLFARKAKLDEDIQHTEEQLHAMRGMRHGIAAVLEAAGYGPHTFPSDTASRKVSGKGERLSAKDCLLKVLRDAGRPLPWADLQSRVSQLPNPPTASAITSAYYHNTKGGARCFLPVGDGYAGLTGRDEGWQPETEPQPDFEDAQKRLLG